MPKKILNAEQSFRALMDKQKAKRKEVAERMADHSKEARGKVLKQLWAKKDEVFKGKKVPTGVARYMEALASNICGEPIKDAALAYGLASAQLAKFKTTFFAADVGFAQFMEEVFLRCSFESTKIFLDKKDQMSGPQAAITAGVFADKFLAMRKARQSDYRSSDDNVALEVLQRMETITGRIASIKQAKGRVIEDDADRFNLTDRKGSTSGD